MITKKNTVGKPSVHIHIDNNEWGSTADLIISSLLLAHNGNIGAVPLSLIVNAIISWGYPVHVDHNMMVYIADKLTIQLNLPKEYNILSYMVSLYDNQISVLTKEEDNGGDDEK